MANTDMTDDQVAANLHVAVKAVLKQIPGGKENIRALYLRATRSAAVPLYTSLSMGFCFIAHF